MNDIIEAIYIEHNNDYCPVCERECAGEVTIKYVYGDLEVICDKCGELLYTESDWRDYEEDMMAALRM